MKNFSRLALLFCLCLWITAPALAATDAAHPEEALFPDEPGAPVPTGSWSADAPLEKARAAARTEDEADDAPVPTGSWSASASEAADAAALAAEKQALATEDPDAPMPTGSWSASAPRGSNRPGGGAEEASANPQEFGHLEVTPIKDCYDKLDADEAADIQAHYVRPFAECQGRLQERREQKHAEKTRKVAAETPVADSPRNFVRVQAPPR